MKKPTVLVSLALVVIAAAGLAGCDHHHHDDGSGDATATIVGGKINQATFAKYVSLLTVEDSQGKQTKVPVESDGSFSIAFEVGNSYTIALDPDGSSTPLVVRPGEKGGLETTLVVDAGNSSISLGNINFMDPATADSTTGTVTVGWDGSCFKPNAEIDACVPAQATQLCTQVSQTDHGDDHDGEGDSANTPFVPTRGFGQSRSRLADASKPFGLVEFQAPAVLGCVQGAAPTNGFRN